VLTAVGVWNFVSSSRPWPSGVRIRDRYEQARALDGIARAYRDLDDPDQARQHWRQALEIFADLDAPEAAEVRARLATPEE
jgi:tetratricopeptide (TPR) repeat protein